MNWKEQLLEIENFFGSHVKRDWKPAIELAQKLASERPNDVEVSIRTIYLLHNILMEEEYSNDKHDVIAGLLKKCFDESYQKFSENSEFLFFIGKILYIGEWYFGINDDAKPLQEKLAFKMQEKAFEKEPDNILYEWAYTFSKDEKEKAFALSKQLLCDNSGWLSKLITKGFPGRYIIESIEYCFENYKPLERKQC